MRCPVAVFLAVVLLPAVLTGCRTSEENYRAAYERAISGRDSVMAADSALYGAVRRETGVRTVEMPDGRRQKVYTRFVRPVADGGGSVENLHRYNVVAGRFRQLFNAVSMRGRLVGAGYASAFVVESSEPYYYVVLSSHRTIEDAAGAMDSFPAVISVRPPMPILLDATARVSH